MKIPAIWFLAGLVVILLALLVASATVAPGILPLSSRVATSRIILVLSMSLFVWAVAQAVGWKRTLLGALSVVIVGAAFWTYNTLIWRDAEYWLVADDFKRATAVAKQADIGDGRSGWAESIAIATGVRANLRAGEHMDVATVGYSDETSRRDVFAPADYINISDVRMHASVLYILRSITLIGSEYRLAVYDLNQRAVIADRRVDLRDVK